MSDIFECRTVCPYDCADSCGLIASTDGNKVLSVRGDENHPVTKGLICRKMQHYERDIHNPDRIMTPLKRVGKKGCKESFVPIGWDEAIETICSRWKEIIAEYGADSIVPCSFSGTMGLVQRNCGDAFFNRLGGAELLKTICGAGRGAGFSNVSGVHASYPTNHAKDCDFILLYSDNPKATRIHAAADLAAAKKNGVKVVLVDIYENISANLCDEVILIKPGTDAVFLMAVMNELDKNDMLDMDFIAEYTTGFEELKNAFVNVSAESAAAECGVEADVIKKLAYEWGSAKSPLILAGYGFSRHISGGLASRLLESLPVITGAWKRGGGIAGTMGSASYTNKAPIKRPDLFTGDKSTRRTVNLNQLALHLTDEKNPAMGLYVYISNPAVVVPDSNLVRKGLLRDDIFTVVHERFFTDTAVYADIILPATFSAEHDDIVDSFGNFHMQRYHAVLTPPGECKTNWETFRLLAKGMGFEDEYFKKTADEFIDELIDTDALFGFEISAQKKAALKAGEPILIDVPDVMEIRTADKKFHLAAAHLDYKPDEKKYPLSLVMSHSPWVLNSNFTQREELSKHNAVPTLRMHPEDAAIRGLNDGDNAFAFNDHGRIGVRISVTDKITKGVVNAEGLHRDIQCLSGGSFSMLSTTDIADSGGGPLHNAESVEVVKQ